MSRLHTPSSSTAILVLARDPRVESKNLRIGRARETTLHTSLLRQALHRVERGRGNVDAYLTSDASFTGTLPRGWGFLPQHGSTFAVRIASAVDALFEQDYARVIIVASDTPHLRVEDIRRATSAASGRSVQGPAADGGLYLLTLGREQRALLLDLPWQTPRLRSALVAACSAHGSARLEWLPLRSDVDHAGDLHRMRCSLERICRRYALSLHVSNAELWPLDRCEARALPASPSLRDLSRRGPPALRSCWV